MKNLKVLTMACTLIAMTLFFSTAKADVGISQTIDCATDSSYKSEFKSAASAGPLGATLKAQLDINYEVEVIQLDNAASYGAKGPSTQYLCHVKVGSDEKWILSKTDPRKALTAAYKATGAQEGAFSWTQGDDEEVVIPASAVE